MEEINLIQLKKEARILLDGKMLKLLLCYAGFFAIAAILFGITFLTYNPLEYFLFELLSSPIETLPVIYIGSLPIDLANVCGWLVWGLYKFFRSIIFFALLYPFIICMSSVPLSIAQKKEFTIKTIFSPIKSTRYFIEFVIAGAMKYFYTILWTLLLIIPGINALYKFSFAKYELFLNPELTGAEALVVSAEKTENRRGYMFETALSFFGWFLLGVATCGIGLLYMLCYASVTKALYYIKCENIEPQSDESNEQTDTAASESKEPSENPPTETEAESSTTTEVQNENTPTGENAQTTNDAESQKQNAE